MRNTKDTLTFIIESSIKSDNNNWSDATQEILTKVNSLDFNILFDGNYEIPNGTKLHLTRNEIRTIIYRNLCNMSQFFTTIDNSQARLNENIIISVRDISIFVEKCVKIFISKQRKTNL